MLSRHFLIAVRSRASGLRVTGAACRVMGSRHSVRGRWAGLCWREGGSRLLRTLVLRKRSCGPAPAGPPVRRVAARIAIRLEQARARCGTRCPWLCGVFPPTQKQHKPGARAKINTGVTRTKRHSPAYGGTRSTVALSENLASSPAEMRVSWADYPFPGRWAKGDRPSEKRKVGGSPPPLTTTSDQGKHPVHDRGPGVFACRGLSLGPRSKRTIGGSAGTGEQPGPVGSQHRRARRGGRRLRASARPADSERLRVVPMARDAARRLSKSGWTTSRQQVPAAEQMADRQPNRASAMTFCDPLVNGRRGYLSEFVLGLVGGESPRCRQPNGGPSGMSG